MSNNINISSAAVGLTSVSNLLLATLKSYQGYQPQPNPVSAPYSLASLTKNPALLFHYEGEQTAIIQSDITDHWTENNSTINDQIALKPVEITTHGFIGELNDVAPPGLALLELSAEKLTSITAYNPGLSVAALDAYNKAFATYQLAASTANSTISAAASLAGGQQVIGSNGLSSTPSFAQSFTQNKQQATYQQFYAYWFNRALFTVQTPWAIFQDMAIKSLRAIQDADTQLVTDFEITFKQMRFASTTNLLEATSKKSTISANGAASASGGSTLTPPLAPDPYSVTSTGVA